MNVRIFIISALVLLFFASCQKEILDDIQPENLPVISYLENPVNKPIATDSAFWFINSDYTFRKISSSGTHQIISDIKDAFPVVEVENSGYEHFNLTYSEETAIFSLTCSVENSIYNTYSAVNWADISASGDIIFQKKIRLPEIDSTLNRSLIGTGTDNELHYATFDITTRGPSEESNIYIMQYNSEANMMRDSLINFTGHMSLVWSDFRDKQITLWFNEMSPLGSKLVIYTFNSDFELLNSKQFELDISTIYNVQLLQSGNFLIAGQYSNPISEESPEYNFLAEINMDGQIIRYTTTFDVETGTYSYYYDFLEVGTDIITCGINTASYGYMAFDALSSYSYSYFFVGKINGISDTELYGNSSEYGASAGLAIIPATYGYALLTYMSYTYTEPTEQYLWLYKLDENFQLIEY